MAGGIAPAATPGSCRKYNSRRQRARRKRHPLADLCRKDTLVRSISFVTAIVLLLTFGQSLSRAEQKGRTVAVHPDWVNALKPAGATSSELILASNGKTAYRIVVPSCPTSQEIKAATDLQHWLRKMTAAEFVIVAESDSFVATGREISIGNTTLLQQAEIPQKQVDLADEGYAIGVDGKRLYILGGRRRGPIYGVYALLEEDLGCRWYARCGPSRS